MFFIEMFASSTKTMEKFGIMQLEWGTCFSTVNGTYMYVPYLTFYETHDQHVPFLMQ